MSSSRKRTVHHPYRLGMVDPLIFALVKRVSRVLVKCHVIKSVKNLRNAGVGRTGTSVNDTLTC